MGIERLLRRLTRLRSGSWRLPRRSISCSVATVVAMALPCALARLGGDPAFGSGPLATVIQDLLSIVACFAIAVLLVT